MLASLRAAPLALIRCAARAGPHSLRANVRGNASGGGSRARESPGKREADGPRPSAVGQCYQRVQTAIGGTQTAVIVSSDTDGNVLATGANVARTWRSSRGLCSRTLGTTWPGSVNSVARALPTVTNVFRSNCYQRIGLHRPTPSTFSLPRPARPLAPSTFSLSAHPAGLASRTFSLSAHPVGLDPSAFSPTPHHQPLTRSTFSLDPIYRPPSSSTFSLFAPARSARTARSPDALARSQVSARHRST